MADVEARWVDAYFPFTHPSWELEVQLNGAWVEMLGCGIMEQEILVNGECKLTCLIFFDVGRLFLVFSDVKSYVLFSVM